MSKSLQLWLIYMVNLVLIAIVSREGSLHDLLKAIAVTLALWLYIIADNTKPKE